MSVDFHKIISSSPDYNFHSHTQYCDGKASMADFARQAVALGMRYYGFSPHSPVPIESPCNMKKEDVPFYKAEADRLQKEYDGKIKFFKGMEIDYLGDEWGPASPYFSSLGLDYSIGSVHFIPSDSEFVDIDGNYEGFRKKMEKYFSNDIKYVVKSFYKQSRDMVMAGGFDILGHFDKIGHNAGHFREGIEDEEWYKNEVNDLIDLIIEKKLLIELNTKAWKDHRRMFPSPRYLPRLIKAGVTIMVNSDAHHPQLIDASRKEAFDMIESSRKASVTV